MSLQKKRTVMIDKVDPEVLIKKGRIIKKEVEKNDEESFQEEECSVKANE